MATTSTRNSPKTIGFEIKMLAAVKKTKALVCKLCRNFYNLGWFSGTGGSFSVKVILEDLINHQLIVMTPSGVQKEMMEPDELFILCSNCVPLLDPPPKLYPYDIIPPNCTDSAVLFLKIYEMRNAGAVIHSHAMESCIVTMIDPSSNEFHMKNIEMIKGIQGHSYNDELVVPIIENTLHEKDLLDSLTKAIIAYPKSNAAFVRNHGVFIWGDTWITAKTLAECYHYLFGAALKLHQFGLIHFPRKSSTTLRPFILMEITTATDDPYNILRPNSVDIGEYVVSNDGVQALRTWHSSGIKSQLFSSTKYGDLRKYLSGFFYNGDLMKYFSGFFYKTSILPIRPIKFKIEIPETVGASKASDILFVTNSFNDALSAKDAGMEAAILNVNGIGQSSTFSDIKYVKALNDI